MNKIKYWRVTKGYTVRKLARMAGIEKNTLLYIEKGERQPQEATLGKIAAALGLDIREIMTDDGQLKKVS